METTQDAQLRGRAIGDLLSENSGKDLAQLSRLLSKGEVHRGIYRQIDELVTDLHEVLAETTSEAWDALPRSAELAVAELTAYLDAIDRFPLHPWPTLEKARQKDIEQARQGNWFEFISKGLGPCVISGARTYRRIAIPEEICHAYEAVCRHASAVLRNRLATQNHATHQLLSKYDRHYRDMQFLPPGGFDSRTSLAFWQMHFLRDLMFGLEELLPSPISCLMSFKIHQHLSGELAPLARRCAAEKDGSFFCVGDPKQAIYRWRGGVAELFDVLERDVSPLEWQNLDQSYRSSPIIIDLVNAVFGTLMKNEVFAHDPIWHGVVSKWSERFQTHHSARADRPGYVRFVVAPDDAEQSDLFLRFIADEIIHIQSESPGATIGVLVRENRTVAQILNELRNRHVEASEEGGNPLSRSPAVSLILSFLDWLDHPGNSASFFHVTHSPLGSRLGLLPDTTQEDQGDLSRLWRSNLIELGYAETIRRLVDLLQPGLPRTSQNSLEQLLEIAVKYSPRSTLRPTDFVTYVEETKVDDPSTASLRVMTIHQAKGLEFDIVVLPELGKIFAGRIRVSWWDENIRRAPSMLSVVTPTLKSRRFCQSISEKSLTNIFERC